MCFVISRRKVYGPFVFGKPTVTGSAYLDAISQLWLVPQLKKSESDSFVWQQDRAPPHWNPQVMIGSAADHTLPFTADHIMTNPPPRLTAGRRQLPSYTCAGVLQTCTCLVVGKSVYFMTIGGKDWSGRWGLTWLLPDVLKVESFTWERAGWLLSDWMLSGEDNDSYCLPKGFKIYKMENGRCLSSWVWSAMGEMCDPDQALGPLIAAGLKLPSNREV
ncbi:hypothetical protein TNCV_2090891 [Trichonephila clavipes]|nr:hypothetical protein TNCV_2090891 [Trichonephila clavipes]